MFLLGLERKGIKVMDIERERCPGTSFFMKKFFLDFL